MSKKDKKEEKALFIQRFMAFIIDILLVTIVAAIISTPFVDVDESDKLQKKTMQIMEKFNSKKITANEYINEYKDTYYKIQRNNGLVSIVTIFLNVLYFVVFQLYNKGQTIGKKLMKIRVVSDDGELFANQMIYRSLLSNFILMDLICFCLMLFSPKNIFFFGSVIVEFIQYIIVFISVIMIMRKNDGRAIHDKLAHTTVVRI